MSANSSVFRGEGDELLDHLLVACHGHRLNKPLASFGRELQPFFAPGEDMGPLDVVRNKNCPSVNNPAPKKSAKGGRKTRVASPVSHSRAESISGDSFTSDAAAPALAACPGFFSSPQPTALPRPSMFMMTRACTTVAA